MRRYEHSQPGRIDSDGIEWWACDPYPTWYRWENGELFTKYGWPLEKWTLTPDDSFT